MEDEEDNMTSGRRRYFVRDTGTGIGSLVQIDQDLYLFKI